MDLLTESEKNFNVRLTCKPDPKVIASALYQHLRKYPNGKGKKKEGNLNDQALKCAVCFKKGVQFLDNCVRLKEKLVNKCFLKSKVVSHTRLLKVNFLQHGLLLRYSFQAKWLAGCYWKNICYK